MATDKQLNLDGKAEILLETPGFIQSSPRQGLRRRAEDKAREIIARMPENLAALSPEEIRQTFHELRVHKVELEMQNEELRRTQVELDATRRRYFDLYDQAPVGYCILSESGLILEVNLTAATLLDVSRAALIKQPFTRFIHQEDQDTDYLHRKRLFETGEPQVCALRMFKKDGTVFWVRLEATTALDEGGAPTCRLMLSDISEYKAVVEALQQSEQKTKDAQKLLQLVMDTIPVRLYWKNLNSAYLGCNRLFAHDVGCRNPEEMIGAVDSSLGFEQPNKIYHQQDDLEVLLSGMPKFHHEVLQTTPEGKQIWLSKSIVPLRDANDQIIGVLGTYEDITQRKWADEELLKSQKIEALGLLAGGIAHDFNNILMAIMGNISMAKMLIAPTDKAHARLLAAESATLRAKELTRQFLTFSHGGAPVKRSISVAHMIKVYSQFALSGTKSTCEYALADDLWEINADDGQIGQVLTNVLINADQSMPDGGTIRVHCENMVISQNHGLPLQSGKYVKISIRDQGCGIPKDSLAKIFDPYFTTKEVGRGLGLTAAYSIMKYHKGLIVVESTADSGTTIALLLPASTSRAARPKAEAEPELISGQGRILVMDDEEVVLQVVEAMLENLGYQVERAVNGEEALAKYIDARQSAKPFDAVIMDLIVPGGMGGKEAIQKLLAVDPQAKVIVSSGYCYDPVMADFKNYGFKGVIAKPYLLAGLSEQMRKLHMEDKYEST